MSDKCSVSQMLLPSPHRGRAEPPLQGDRSLEVSLPAQVPYRNRKVTTGKWAKKKGEDTWGWATSFPPGVRGSRD